MGSSKVWRKGRWFWHCNKANNPSSWADYSACGACSRLTYSTKKEATKAAGRHAYKSGHPVLVQQIR